MRPYPDADERSGEGLGSEVSGNEPRLPPSQEVVYLESVFRQLVPLTPPPRMCGLLGEGGAESRHPERHWEFCLSCHIDANVGDVLGTVTVRNYFASHLLHWWEEVDLTATLGMGKVFLHTIVLFFLLKVRMEPLISLRSV